MRLPSLLFTLLLSLTGFSQTADSIEIVSWNVFLRPAFLKDNQMGRVDSIAGYLNNTNADILVLQEVFHRKARKRLITELSTNYPHHTKVGKTSILGVSSGVMIFSQVEIQKEKRVYFKKATKADQLAKKGGVFAEVTVKGKTIDVIGTHLQAGSEEKCIRIRKEQIALLKTLAEDKHRPTVFVGDFNMHRHSAPYKELIKVLECENITPNDSIQCTANFSDQALMPATGSPKWIDFILLRKINRMKIAASRIEQPMFHSKGKRHRLSDHNPIHSIILCE